MKGVVLTIKPGHIIIQPDDGPTILSKMTIVGGLQLEKGQSVTFEPSFSAMGPLAENVRTT